MANGCIALSGEGHDDPACGGTVDLADHEVDFAYSFPKAPWVTFPVIPIESDWDGQQLQNI